MKKIFTLLFCTTILSIAAFAQDGHRGRDRGNGGYAYNDRGHDRNFSHDEFRGGRDRDDHGYRDNDHSFFGRILPRVRIRPAVNIYFTYRNYRYGIDQRDAVIAQINAYYDQQEQAVANDWSLNDWQKRDAINNLEAQRTAEINNIYSQCGDAAPYPGQY